MISLKEERLKRGLTVNRVVKDTGYSLKAIQHLEENGFPKRFKTPILEDLCSYYEINYYMFLSQLLPTDTVGQRIKFVRYLTSRSIPNFKDDVFGTSLSNAENEKTKMSADNIIYFAKETGVNLNWLLLGEGEIFRGGKQV